MILAVMFSDFMNFPFCSILVLNYNGKKYLNRCFNAIQKINYQKDRYEVIMIDNCSSDGSVEMVNKKFPWVKTLFLEKNYGFGEGFNRGIEIANGEYIIILNNDTMVDKDWLIELVKVANTDKKIGICGSKISDEKLGDVGEGHINFLGTPSQKDNENVTKCFWISDCSMLIKKEVIKKLGRLYDPSFFMYFEEVDVCWRAMLLGYDVYYVPNSLVHHTGSASSSKAGSIMKFYHYRNKIWTFKKNLRFPLDAIMMVPISAMTLAMIAYWTVLGKWDQGIRVMKYVFLRKEKNPVVRKVPLKDQIRLFFK